MHAYAYVLVAICVLLLVALLVFLVLRRRRLAQEEQQALALRKAFNELAIFAPTLSDQAIFAPTLSDQLKGDTSYLQSDAPRPSRSECRG